ncbi:MAG: phosphate transport system substrate-binding protein [Bacteriovoracaceae bacterium]|jgi:phosphate transport system substrate-binding protein
MKHLFLIATVFLALDAFAASKMKGKVSIDGSSTVFPITEAIAEEFRAEYPRVRVNIGVSGTGGGFKKFTTGEIDINNASRTIKDKEKSKAAKNKVDYAVIAVAYDGITVVINNNNTWAKNMTKKDLRRLWDAGSKITTWKQLNSAWPDRKIKLYGPGTDSGTFDYFTKAINGKSGKCRFDFMKSEDDNVLVSGVAGDIDAIGFFGYAYYKENKKKLQAVAIDGVAPDMKTINNGSYKPLSRPIFIYVNKASYKRPEVKAFVDFYINSASGLVSEVGYVPLTDEMYKEQLKKF